MVTYLNVKELRARTGLSQSKFAAKFHIQLGTLRTWEQGIRECPEHIFWMMSRILELEDSLRGGVGCDAGEVDD